MNPFFLGVIPARTGSKGIAGKNLRLLGGKPLIVHTIEAARASRRLTDFLVSTDGEEIAGVARAAGAPVPFLRPAEFAGDATPTVDAVMHAVSWYEGRYGRTVDAVVLLQPTSPFRTGEDIDAAIVCFVAQEVPSLVSCYDAAHVHPSIMYTLAGAGLEPLLPEGGAAGRRQEFMPVYVRNGAIYITSRQLVMKARKIYDEKPVAYVMPRERSLNIDDPFDLELAEGLLMKRKG